VSTTTSGPGTGPETIDPFATSDVVGSTPTSPRSRGLRSRLYGWGPPSVVLMLFVGLWYFLSNVVLEDRVQFLLPPPHDVIRRGMLDPDRLVPILEGLWSTTLVSVTGLAIAIAIGVVTAVLMSQARWIEASLFPYAVALQTVPILALVPLVGFWFGFNFRSRVLVCVIIALFPIITNTLFGLQSVNRGMHDLFTLHGASRWTRLRKLQFPAGLPAIFTGFRISAGLSVIGAIVGDFFFRQGTPGIGQLLDVYARNLRPEELFTAIFFSSLLGIVMFWLFGVLGRLVTGSWADGAGGGD
jgi:NitT/TauT family transport system permease protein